MNGFAMSMCMIILGMFFEYINKPISNVILVLIAAPLCMEGVYYFTDNPLHEETTLQSWKHTHRYLDEEVAKAYLQVWEIKLRTGKSLPMKRQKAVYIMDATLSPQERILDEIGYYQYSCKNLKETLDIFTDFIQQY